MIFRVMPNEKDKTCVAHRGMVSDVNGNEVTVSIISKSACAGCKVQKTCAASDMKEKKITAVSDERFEIGDEVDVMISQNIGYKAVFFAYILPLIFIVGLIVGMVKTGFSEGLAGVGAIILLFLYFFVLYLLRNKLNNKVKIEIVKR